MGEYYSNSRPTVLNKLHVQSYSRISVLGPEGHCTNRFKRAVWISCRPRVDVHKGEGGLAHVDRGGGQKPDFYGRHKWMTPYDMAWLNLVEIVYLL